MSTNEHYQKLVVAAKKNMEIDLAKGKVQNERTIAAVMFIKTHKNFIRNNANGRKIRMRQNMAIADIKEHVSGFDHDLIKWELTKIGIPSHKFVSLFLSIFFMAAYVRAWPVFIEVATTTIDKVALTMFSFCVYYIVCLILGGMICSSKIPTYICRKDNNNA